MALKEATLHFRIDSATREQLEAIALREERTLSQVAARALAEWLRASKPRKGRAA